MRIAQDAAEYAMLQNRSIERYLTFIRDRQMAEMAVSFPVTLTP